ncbi:hypothetical protein [Peribacillus sp. SCS-155]|uniref:hypothetical protein n=1 Tax=Peribacillus sedimenti TaxID=3115297 RepID=UPI00390601DB
MFLPFKTLLSIFLLFVSLRYLHYQYNYRSAQKTVKFYLLFLIGSIPLIYVLYVDSFGSNAVGKVPQAYHRPFFYITWLITAGILTAAMILKRKNKRQRF